MKKKECISFKEFENTVYYTQYKIVIPLLDIRLDKFEYFTKNKYDIDKVNNKILELYEENKDKLR